MSQLFSRDGRWMNFEQTMAYEKRKREEAGIVEEPEKRFCEFCDAKGPIKHKKDCPTLKPKIEEIVENKEATLQELKEESPIDKILE